MQPMWCHRSLGRRSHTTCQKPKEEILLRKRKRGKIVGSGEENLMVRDEVLRTTLLWRSTTMVRKLKRHI